MAVKYDEVAERRRAKAMKVSIFGFMTSAVMCTIFKMLDAKMAELSRKSEGWDDVSVLYLSMSFTSMICNFLVKDHSPIETENNDDLGKFRV